MPGTVVPDQRAGESMTPLLSAPTKHRRITADSRPPDDQGPGSEIAAELCLAWAALLTSPTP